MKFLKDNILYFAWVQALVATLGSLYFSEIQQFPPCTLCWYQRIFIYPLVILLPVGIIRQDRQVDLYVLPLAILGWLVAFYQVLLERGIVVEKIALCQSGVSCTTKYINYFGLITIPTLSLLAFSFIILCMLIFRSNNHESGS